MFKTFVLLIFGVCLTEFASSGSLPNYLEACKAGPKFNECVLKTTNHVIPILVKGDRKVNAPPFDPLEFQKITVNEGNRKSIAMNVTLLNGKITGLKDCKATKINFDLDKKNLHFELKVPKVLILSDYEVAGKFLILPITGKGPCKLDLDNVVLDFYADYKLEKINGEEHIQVTKSNLKHKLSKLHVELKNLFNGDKALGDNMNLVLNENWADLNESIGPSITKAIGMVVAQIFNEISKAVPYKELIIF